jgi:hypothetical protein
MRIVPVSLHKKIMWLPALLMLPLVLAPTSRAEAQYWHAHVLVGPRVVVAPYYYSPFWYDPWYGAYQYPWGPYPYPPYRVYQADPGASLRLEVKPKEAEVYVDGYYAGIVDDFDGTFQRLSVTPGEHDITLFLDGYRTVHQQVRVAPRKTFNVKYAMEQLAAGEQPEPRPQPPAPPPGAQTGGRPGEMPPPTAEQPPQGRAPRPLPPQPMPPPPPPGNPRAGAPAGAYGTLAIRVQPGDADIMIDGERWHGPDSQDRLLVDVAEGSHTVQISKPGYRTYVTDVQVRRGETSPLNVSLRSQDER